MTEGRKVVTASCHCGAVRVEMSRKARKLTQCNCSICRRYGALWAYFQRKSVTVISNPNVLGSYTWGNENLEFFHCTICACVTHYEKRVKNPDGFDMSAVNFRNIDDPTVTANLPIRLLDGAGSWKKLSEAPQPYLLQSPG